jgi:hypothetical protein
MAKDTSHRGLGPEAWEGVRIRQSTMVSHACIMADFLAQENTRNPRKTSLE